MRGSFTVCCFFFFCSPSPVPALASSASVLTSRFMRNFTRFLKYHRIASGRGPERFLVMRRRWALFKMS
ncbi:hypothetical protein CSUI_005221, partial [Cystoisospora suis]